VIGTWQQSFPQTRGGQSIQWSQTQGPRRPKSLSPSPSARTGLVPEHLAASNTLPGVQERPYHPGPVTLPPLSPQPAPLQILLHSRPPPSPEGYSFSKLFKVSPTQAPKSHHHSEPAETLDSGHLGGRSSFTQGSAERRNPTPHSRTVPAQWPLNPGLLGQSLSQWILPQLSLLALVFPRLKIVSSS
jgi:hypothetical protein